MFDFLNPILTSNALTVLAGTSLLGLACGSVGSFAVLRRRSLVGDALAHAALPGICTAYLAFGQRSFPLLFAWALLFGLLSVWCIWFIRRATHIKEDAAIAVVLSSFFGLGIALSRLIQNRPTGNRAGLDDFIFGKAASMVRQDVWVIASISLVTIIAITLLTKELKLLCFDREFAWAQGLPVRLLDIGLMTLICLCTVVGLPAVGVVLVSALLIFPGVTARLWTHKLETMVALGGAFGLVACFVGTILSAIAPGPGLTSKGLPTGPVIVLTCAALFAFSLVVTRHVLPLIRREQE